MADSPIPVVRAEVVNNLGFWTAAQQLELEDSCVAVAGLGGAGGLVVELLGRCGIRKWKLADPDTSELSNLGRQAGSTYATVGQPKVWIAAQTLQSVNRSVAIETYTDGVTPENVDAFLDQADVVLDAIAIEKGWLSVLLGRRARELAIPMITSIEVGDGCQYTAFLPSAQVRNGSVDAFFGVDPQTRANEHMHVDVDSMLSYVPPSFPSGLTEALDAGMVRTPAHAMGVARNASAVSRAIRQLLLFPSSDHDFAYPYVVVDEPDPKIGTFRVHHRDRQSSRECAFERLETDSTPKFSSVDQYEVEDLGLLRSAVGR